MEQPLETYQLETHEMARAIQDNNCLFSSFLVSPCGGGPKASHYMTKEMTMNSQANWCKNTRNSTLVYSPSKTKDGTTMHSTQTIKYDLNPLGENNLGKCTFAPKINNKSKRLVSKTHNRTTSFGERLYNKQPKSITVAKKV